MEKKTYLARLKARDGEKDISSQIKSKRWRERETYLTRLKARDGEKERHILPN